VNKVKIIGIAGGSGSGKTYFAQALSELIGAEHSALIYQDNFYIDQSHKFDYDGGSVNFDHPDSLDFPLLAKKLLELREGSGAEIPIYDFATHKRKTETYFQPHKKIIIVDGILIFHPPYIRNLLDDMIFFDTPEDLRYRRRLERDVKERGRTPEGVKAQFLAQVKPMHDQFVQPSMQHAHKVVKDGQGYLTTLEETFQKIRKFIANC
jgi:uridine kinase